MSGQPCGPTAELGAGYALGALEPSEREALEAHASGCPACAAELTNLLEISAQLAQSLPQQQPPAAVRQRVLAVARAESRAEGTPPRSPRLAERRSGGALPWLALAAALAALLWGASLQAQLGTAQQQLAEASVQLAASRRQTSEVSAQLERIRSGYWTVASVLAAQQVRERELQPAEAAPGAHGKVWVDPATGRGMLMARDLPRLPESQAYQVWLVNAEGRVSGGLLRANEEGVYYVVLQAPGRLTDYQRLGITIEPASGSPGPTGPRVIGGEI